MEYSWKTEWDLRLVFHLSEQRALENGIDLVIIPGLWAQSAPGLAAGLKDFMWLKLLVASTDHDVRVFIFNYDVKHQGGASGAVWHQLLSLSRVLLNSLHQARPYECRKRPIYFICYGLSGILLKHALYLAQQELPAIQNAIAGLIFLGSPHLTSVTDQRWELWKMILKLFRKGLPKDILRKEDIKALAEVCRKFSSLNIDIPVLSVYETIESKMRSSGPLGRFRTLKKVLVDREHAMCHTTNEELFGVPLDHHSLLPVTPGSSLFDKLVIYLKNAPGAGVQAATLAYQRLGIDTEPSDTVSRVGYQLDQSQDAHRSPSIADLIPRPKRIILPCYSLEHTRSQTFFGQNHVLERIDQELTPEQPEDETFAASNEIVTPKACAIYGIGGLGKTEIAIEYVHTRKPKFDAIFWVNSSTRTRILAGFRNIAILLGLQGENTVLNEGPEVTRDKVKAWLADPMQTLSRDSSESGPPVRWLLVFDNADDLDLLYEFWPIGGNGCVLVTSRDQMAETTSLPNLVGIELAPMNAEDATRFLKITSQREDESESNEACGVIADKLSGLPLAIVQMAHVIRTKHLSLMEFIEYYEYDSKKFHELPLPGYTKQQTIAFIWDIESLSPGAMALLQVLSMLDGDSIPEEVLTKGTNAVVLQDYPTDKVAYFEAREALMKSSLVTRNKKQGTLRIHRLVQEVVRQKLDLELFRAVVNSDIALLSAVWPFLDYKNLNEVDRLRKVQRYQPQVTSLRSRIESKGVEIVKPSIMVGALFNESSWLYLLAFNDYGFKAGDEFAVLAERVAEVSEVRRENSIRSKIISDSYRFQGIIGSYVNSKKGIECTKKWIDTLIDRIEKYQEQEDIVALPIAYNEYGRALMWVPDKKEALRSWETSCGKVLEMTKPNELPFPFPWMHRAIVHSLDGNANAAESILLPVLEEREKILGKDDTSTYETGLILICMGNIKRLQGDRDASYAFNQRAVSVVPVATGERSLFSIQAYYRLAYDNFERERFAEAHELLDKVVTFIGNAPWSKAIAARGNWKLGHTLLREGGSDNEDEARVLLDRAMELYHELDPDDHRNESDLTDADWDRLVFYLFQ